MWGFVEFGSGSLKEEFLFNCMLSPKYHILAKIILHWVSRHVTIQINIPEHNPASKGKVGHELFVKERCILAIRSTLVLRSEQAKLRQCFNLTFS